MGTALKPVRWDELGYGNACPPQSHLGITPAYKHPYCA